MCNNGGFLRPFHRVCTSNEWIKNIKKASFYFLQLIKSVRNRHHFSWYKSTVIGQKLTFFCLHCFKFFMKCTHPDSLLVKALTVFPVFLHSGWWNKGKDAKNNNARGQSAHIRIVNSILCLPCSNVKLDRSSNSN